MIVMKFGGTSVGNAQSMKTVVELIRSRRAERPIVVISAMNTITDSLIAAAKSAAQGAPDVQDIESLHYQVISELGLDAALIEDVLAELRSVIKAIADRREVTPKLLDATVSFGERLSSIILAAYASLVDLPSKAYTSYHVGLVTDSSFGNAQVLSQSFDQIRNALSGLPASEIPIITGFIAKDEHDAITTIGRGGSDYTAAIFGAAMDAARIEIWTDVDGVMTADPRVVPNARTVEEISFQEASELARFGAKVLHPKTIRPAMNKGIPVKVLNTANPDHAGTTIRDRIPSSRRMTSITCRKNVNIISIHSEKMLMAVGFLHKIFKAFEDERVSVDIIATSEVNVAVTVGSEYNLDTLLPKLQALADVHVERNKSSINVVGCGFKVEHGMGVEIFGALAEAGVNVEMTSQGASDYNMSLVVDGSNTDRAIIALHDKLFP